MVLLCRGSDPSLINTQRLRTVFESPCSGLSQACSGAMPNAPAERAVNAFGWFGSSHTTSSQIHPAFPAVWSICLAATCSRS